MKGRLTHRAAVRRLVLFGLVSAGLYSLAFAFAAPLTSLFARGGIYCLLPVLTVFVVSYFHAGFAGSVWRVLGVVSAPVRGSRAVRNTSRARR